MKKFPRKFQYPLMVSMVLPTMLLSMPAIMVAKSLPEGGVFFDAWLYALGQMLPSALILLAVVAPTVRLFVTKVLLEPEAK
ncbi:DUF2798 domain-containing protein [Photobacterium sp. BZF1]|uniref:DUF2798 domain-containing protein n=1 Tax=Photobacterium rosenbergii TaxID=294936 RepID=A0A2T3NF57_9GAMM|nr:MULTISPECIES: DUF2798 domain-containing protein [Photobacterium]MBC7003172.1 DUF2798 domain-containing protein [Photobacterium sp. BZF1]PSW13195.1 DUF2798 domain-containing protein [Photobacterium rosenbergii]